MTTNDDNLEEGNFEDDNLLESLGHLFAADTAQQPSPAELSAFRNLFAADASAVVDPTMVMSAVDPTSTIERHDVVDPTMQLNTVDATTVIDRTKQVVVPFIRPARRLGRRLAMTGAVAVIGLTGTTALAAAANEGALPRPVRVVAHGVGLPVDSVELADAKHALSKLRKASDAALPSAVAGADDALAKLSDDDRRRLGQPAAQEVEDARGRVDNSNKGSNNSGSGSNSGGNSGSGSGSNDAPTTVPTKSGDSTPATTAEFNSGKGGTDSTTVTTTEDNSGRGPGGGSSTTTIASGSGSSGDGGSGSGSGSDRGSTTTATTAAPGSGSGSGSGGSGGGSGGGGGSGSSGGSGSGSGSPTTTTTRP